MSVRDGLLSILTLGPAYGHQLHAELRLRAAHRGPVNVGQIYTTIERLTRQKLVEQRGSTSDGLPLYRLTAAGRTAAASWMTTPVEIGAADWTEMLDQLLITSTIDADAARSLAGHFDGGWRRELAALPSEDAVRTTDGRSRDGADAGPGPVEGSAQTGWAIDARRTLAGAAIDWLARFSAGIDETSEFGFAPSRPLRGRRPKSTATAPSEDPAIPVVPA